MLEKRSRAPRRDKCIQDWNAHSGCDTESLPNFWHDCRIIQSVVRQVMSAMRQPDHPEPDPVSSNAQRQRPAQAIAGHPFGRAPSCAPNFGARQFE